MAIDRMVIRLARKWNCLPRFLTIGGAETRAGWIALAQYLEEQMPGAADECWSIPEFVNGKPWPMVFLKSLCLNFRKRTSSPQRGGEAPPAKLDWNRF